MRHLLAAAALSVLSFGAQASTPAGVVAAFHQALAAGDTAKAQALLSPKVEIYESGYVERTRDDYAAHHLASDVQFARAATSMVVHQSERIAGDMAIVTSETETKGSFRGRPVNQAGTETVVLEKQGDDWLIAHVHWPSHAAK